MAFRFCRYCKKIEGDMNLMSYHVGELPPTLKGRGFG